MRTNQRTRPVDGVAALHGDAPAGGGTGTDGGGRGTGDGGGAMGVVPTTAPVTTPSGITRRNDHVLAATEVDAGARANRTRFDVGVHLDPVG
jgi:hypothetical protein